jgi:hypothetical protein
LVGPSKAPIATPMKSLCTGSQKSDEPQVGQMPRRTFSEDWNHFTSPRTVSDFFGTSVDTK